MKMRKRLLSLLLTAALLLGMFPALALTANAETGKTYEIKSFAELLECAMLSHTKTFEGETVELVNDIVLTDEDLQTLNNTPLFFGNFTEVESGRVPFSGTFKGNGHKISGLKYSSTLAVEVSTALFAYTKDATIQDLTIENTELDADLLGGIMIGYAENTKVVNCTVSGSDLKVDCADNVLTLITDGGMIGGVLIGRADNCTVYNCEVNATRVHTAATGAVEALGGKDLYLGALVGSATGSTIEYCRVIDGIKEDENGNPVVTKCSVKNSYDVAVGALGGNKVYAGGIAGQIKDGTKLIDSFSTASLYTYCATYVAVGAGNVGYVGGITAAMYGSGCEITRCHYAGNATSKQYNAVVAIPIIQNNKNVSGIAERVDSGNTVTGTYFRPSDSPDTTMKVLGDSNVTAEYGPKDNTLYADRSFWTDHDYDFAGTVERSSAYSESHTNKWVMDYKAGIPVHGYSVAAGFDFPDAGSVTIGATDLVNEAVTTDDAYDFAVQGFKPKDEYNVNLTAAANTDFRFVEWYRIPDVTASSAPEGHEYFAAMMKDKTPVSDKASYSAADCSDNDLFLAHMEVLVRFHDIDGDVIDKDSGEDSDDTSDDWYDFEEALPDVEPTAHKPYSKTARLIGWTTEKSTEQGGGYSAISNDKLSQLKQNGSFYQTGDPVEKPMELYPVYADLISNAITVFEGNEQDNNSNRSLREDVGITWVTMDDNNVATIHVGGVGSTNDELTAFPEGYRFLGWYTDDGSGHEVRISQEQEYTLTDVDLSTSHTYTARFEYRVQFWLPQKAYPAIALESDFGFSFSKRINDVYVRYQTQLFTSEWESEYINSNVYQLAPSNASGYQWKFSFWTEDDIRFDTDGTTLKVYQQETSHSAYTKLLSSAAKYNTNKTVTAPLELSGLWQHPDPYAQRSAYVYTDFPYSALVEETAVTGNDDRTVSAKLNTGYNFVFWNMYGVITEKSIIYDSAIHQKYAAFGRDNAGDLSIDSSTNAIVWATGRTTSYNTIVINYTHYYIAHNTADVNFHTAAGELIKHATVSKADFPYLSEDKPVTMTRRYQSKVFGTANNVYSGDGNSDMSKDPTDYTSTKAELGKPAEALEAAAKGYFFVGWAEPAQMEEYERAYAFDISNGTSVEGAPQYVSSSVDRAKAYTLKSDALVEHTMELYPVYVPLGNIETTTNLSAARSESLTVPDDPTYTVTNPNENGVQTVTVTADMDALLPDGSGDVYKLIRMTVSVDDGEEVELTDDLKNGVFEYNNIQAGHSYLFTAYYLPYVVIFHQNGTEEMVTQIYNQYDHIRNTPLPTVQDEDKTLDDYIFIGWTEQKPEDNEKYIKADNMTSFAAADDIYHFVDDGTSVSHAMELWPVYTNFQVSVNSNIDAELIADNKDPEDYRMVYRDTAASIETKVVAVEVDSYKFYGWYINIPENKLTDDAEYTNERLVSKDSHYHLTGDKPYEATVYTARYLKVYKVIYHDMNGDTLATDYVYENDDHTFVKTEIVTDADGNPVKDESGSEVSVSVPYFPDAISALHEKMTDNQVFETWMWIKTDGTQTEYSEFCNKKIIEDCIGANVAVGSREMHLYPFVWTLSAKDSNNEEYTGLLLSGTFDETTDKVSAYFDGDTAYCQPSITVHVDKTEWTSAADKVTVSNVSQSSIPVTLYPDNRTGVEQLGEENTNKQGNAIFYFNGTLTIEKTGIAELAGEPFLFTVTNTDTEKTQTVSVACKASEDGNTASGSVTLLLPAGTYSVTEDAAWAYRYSAGYKVSYAVTAANSKDKYLTNDNVAVTPIGNTGAKVTCTNEKKDSLKGWLNDAVNKENIFN